MKFQSNPCIFLSLATWRPLPRRIHPTKCPEPSMHIQMSLSSAVPLKVSETRGENILPTSSAQVGFCTRNGQKRMKVKWTMRPLLDPGPPRAAIGPESSFQASFVAKIDLAYRARFLLPANRKPSQICDTSWSLAKREALEHQSA